jgi:predicted Fe-S protein YdhL (DUF1289 family)
MAHLSFMVSRHFMSDRPTPAIQSPCIQLCVMEPDSGFCMGCGRTRDEIASWISLSPAQRETVIGQLDQRLVNLTRNKRRKGGRRTRLADAG